MNKRSVTDILGGNVPEQSKKVYIKKWEQLVEFMGEDRRPNETDYLQYFDHLHSSKRLKASSIWSTYSCLNAIHQRNYGERLQTFLAVTQLLKSYNNSYSRNVAPVFSASEIDKFLSMELDTPDWIVIKAIVAIAISGDLYCAELRDIMFSNISLKNDSSYEVKFVCRKKEGEKSKRNFTIPVSLAVYVRRYITAIKDVLGDDISGALIKGSPKHRFINQPMGKYFLSVVGKKVATALSLPNPDSYTGRCFRRP